MKAWADDDGRELSELTARELEVFRLVAAGKTNEEIAEELAITERTVRTHVSHLSAKLHVQSKLGLSVRWSAEHLDRWTLPTFAVSELEEKIQHMYDDSQVPAC